MGILGMSGYWPVNVPSLMIGRVAIMQGGGEVKV